MGDVTGAAGAELGKSDLSDDAGTEPGVGDVTGAACAELGKSDVFNDAGTEPRRRDMTGATGTRCGYCDNGCDNSIGLGGRGDGCGRGSNEGGDDNGVLDSCCADVGSGESKGNNGSYGGGSGAKDYCEAFSGGDMDCGNSSSGCDGWSNNVDIGSVSDFDEVGGNQYFSDHTQPGCPQCHCLGHVVSRANVSVSLSSTCRISVGRAGARKCTLRASTKACMSG
jgi:hypothetical protein